METKKSNLTNSKFFTSKNYSKCILGGIGGFIAFLVTIMAAKFLGSVFHSIPSAKLESGDFLLAMIGFVLVFLIKFLEQFGKTEKE